VGHSTRPIEELVELLEGARVGYLVDVRTVPRSHVVGVATEGGCSHPRFGE